MDVVDVDGIDVLLLFQIYINPTFLNVRNVAQTASIIILTHYVVLLDHLPLNTSPE